ncbi:TM1802 family CRISPR-associated protein [Petrotoga sp. DB-2]
MGFIDAVYTVGKEFSSKTYEITDYLTVPVRIDGSKEIRIYLKVSNYNALKLQSEEENTIIPLKIEGVSKIDEVDFFAGNKDEQYKKLRYLYKEPPGSNTAWRYSPVLRLSKPKNNKEKNRDAFLTGSKSYISKIEKMIQDFEDLGFFEKGSVQKIINDLSNNDFVDRFLECYSDPKASYLIVFGVEDDGGFLYPGEVKLFQQYFLKKLNDELIKKNVSKKGGICDYCGKESDILLNFDMIFPFATFDKVNFLPAINKNFSNKVYKYCKECFKTFSNAKTYIDYNFVDQSIINNIQIWIIPEFFTTDTNIRDDAFGDLKNYFWSDQYTKEKDLLDYITDPDYMDKPYTAVFHFLFLEQNQAQLVIHQMIEDVPLTRIQKLQKVWEETVNLFSQKKKKDTQLSVAFKHIYRTLRHLVLKEDAEEKVMRMLAMEIIGKILSEERVETKTIKQNFVARIPKLMNDKVQNDYFNLTLNDFLLLIEFLNNYNKTWGYSL